VTSVFNLLTHTKHTVLIFSTTPDVQPVLTEVQRFPAEVIQSFIILPSTPTYMNAAASGATVLVDKEGHAYNGYIVAEGVLNVVIIRPDGFIGAIVTNATDIGKYFSKVFSLK